VPTRDWRFASPTGLAVHSLEAWLLADEAAAFAMFDGDRSNVLFPSPEQELSPKATLNRIVRTLTSGQEVSFAPFADELAQEIRLALLRQRCPHFDEFCISQRHHEVVILAKPAKMGSHGQETDLLSNHHSSTAVPAL